MVNKDLRLSILATLAYSSLFSFPLTISELFERLIGSFPKLTEKELKKSLNDLSLVIVQAGHYVLRGDERFFSVRKKRTRYSRVKNHEVAIIQSILKKFPGISAAYVTGALSVDNVFSIADDVDILIVTKPGLLWITRLCVIIWTSLIGKYRLHGGRGEYGWCFNLWLDETHVTLPEAQRSLYTAYEIVQAKPFIQSSTQNELIFRNPWITEYINYSRKTTQRNIYSALIKPDRISLFLYVWKTLDIFAYFVQILYMSPRKTTERVSRSVAFFHPRDTKNLILKAWKRKMREIGLREKEVEEMGKWFGRNAPTH